MRRMKIRAKPNFGIGGGGAPRNSSVPGRGSGAPVEAQSSQTKKTTLPPLQEDAVCSSPAVASVELTSGAQGMSSDALSVDLQEGTNKSPDSTTTSAFSEMNTSQPSLTNVQGIESFGVTYGGEKLQQVVTNSTSKSGDVVSPSAEISVISEPLKSDIIPVPTPKAQLLPVPEDSSGGIVSQVDTQSSTQTTADVSVDSPHPVAAVPINSTSSNVSKETGQDSDGKSTVCMRRKKLKVKPMLGIVRKGNVMDKTKMKGSVSGTNAPHIKSECVDEKPSVNQASNEENLSCAESNHLTLEMQERADTDADGGNVAKLPNEQRVEKADPNNKTSVVPETSEDNEVCPTEKEVQLAKEETEPKILMSESTCKEVEVMKDNMDTTVVANQMPRLTGDSQTSQTFSNTSASTAGYKRRAKIRAKPTLITKKKKEDDKDAKVKPVQQIPTTDEPLRDASPRESIARECGGVEPVAAVVKPSTDSSESYQIEECKLKPNIVTFKKEVKFAETEVNTKHSHILNVTDDNKDSKESEQAQKMRREGIHANLKESPDSPLHSNLKTSRKKKLNENKEIDPELEVVDVNISVEKQGKERLRKDNCEEVMNSDDSTGDKENASTGVTELLKQEKITKEKSSVITQKAKTKSPVHSLKLFGKLGRKVKVEDDPDSPDKKNKQIFRARKDEFRKKMSGGLERSKMTMFDLIYWNPVSNPMPGRTPSPNRNSGSASKGDTDSVTSEIAEEQQVDDLGLDPADSEHHSRPESPEVVNVSEGTPEKPHEENKDPEEKAKDSLEDSATNEEEASCEKDIFAPRVKIGPNGEIMVDEQSIKIQTTAAKNRDEVLSKAVVVEESGDSSHYGKWSKRRRRSFEWTVKETALFYKALSTVGTDFSLMETLIKWRTRAELKTKFKKEERSNRDLVDLALNDSTQFDMTVFEEESDYDPKEDRKAARQAERAEAKRRRLEMKQQDKIQELEKKKLENQKNKAKIKKRKKVLRKVYRNRGRKRKETFESDNEDSPSLYDSDSASEDSPLEQPQSENTVTVKPRVMLKRRQAKRRNSLVISEVTVTMETVKYDKPAHEALTERTVKEHEASSELILTSPRNEANLGDGHSPHEETHPSNSPDYVTPHKTDEFIHWEEQKNEMNLLNEYSQLPLNEGLPESHIIENMLSENAEIADGNPNINQNYDIKKSEPTTSEEREGSESAETVTELQPCIPPPEPTWDDSNQRMWNFNVSDIQTLEDGRQVIVVPTSTGHYSVPVPVLPPGTSKVVVMATDVPDSPGELIYHVYVVSPLEGGES